MLKADAALLAADVVGGEATGLQQVDQVEGFALNDDAALEVVAGTEAGVLRLFHLKLPVAQITHAAPAVGRPRE